MTERRVRRVNRYSVPRIPTRGQVDSRPEILQSLPERWQGNQAVVSALAAATALTAISGCGGARVAPIFRHGEGVRAFYAGAFAGAPPSSTVCLAEDEARQVIEEEARRAGMAFRTPGPCVKGVRVPTIDSNGRSRPSGTRQIKLETDGVDPTCGIAYEFVSFEDIGRWREEAHGELVPQCDNCLGAAEIVRAGLKGNGPTGVYAIFYDPCVEIKEPHYTAGMSNTTYSAKLNKARKAAERTNREELRKQVRDFVRWLKAQGVI